MTAVGFVAVLALLALVVPFFVYGMLDAEDPDQATSWDDARSRARKDDENSREHAGDERDDDSDVAGNHWG
ncbi:hypothetical protein G9C85_11490 [Halorubellus sp. JP-L1]|uniref:hypothetical protein n=1 Tax=Halorubellus sp. JP-L1 TaxID=2715753 RepID=UPI001409AF2F|nr:hypothetical protein [Halorubellus sp. JP-L1]NHN42243.1 hypothetical protein [Halorubellus sp. JP-L1]